MKLLKLYSILLFSFGAVFAQSELFEDANSSYLNGAYEEAITKYEKILNTDGSSENIHYNLGNAYYHTDQVGLSILHFEKALKYNPNSKIIQHNLHLAYLKTKDKIEPLPQLFIVSWWYSFLNKWNASQWGKGAVFFAFVSLTLLISYKLKNILSLKWLGILGAMISLCLAFFANRKNNYDFNHQYAIITAGEVELKETPNETANNLAKVHEGLKLEIIDQLDDWSQIKLEDGTEAWVLKKVLSEI